jgi:general secretion pathway protein E
MANHVPYLEVKDARGVRTVAVTGAPISIGRNITNMLVLDEPLASRFHSVIEKTRDGYRVRDLDSRNGILVNGQAMKTSTLADGDVVTIGGTELRLVLSLGKTRPANAASHLDAPELESLAADELAGSLEPMPLDGLADAEQEADAGSNLSSGAPDWEKILRDRADSLASRPFRENDISLINSRGVVTHPPTPSAGTRPPPGTEAVTLLRLILLICFRSRATDIHIELKQEDVQIRIRVDGVMLEILRLYQAQRDLAVRLLSLVKILGEIDIAQKNIVQEGSFSARVPSGQPGRPPRRVDYRVSFAPAVYGQKLVIRILDTANSPQHITDLQLPDSIVEPVRRMILQESGMILVCGPTGSGKTTTLYSILRDIDVAERNVVTIEDPVEIQLDGVTQIPVNEAQGNSFSNLLKSVLRQDPDIILVGEIRDAETARTAMQSAMTGHLVFSTVHARDAVSAVYRILDLGVESYLVSSGIQMVLSQRLVRQLCPHCRTPTRPTGEQAARMAQFGILHVTQIFNPKGCRRCLNTGFFGRRSIVELLSFNQALREVVLKTPTMQEILKNLGPENYIRLAENGYHLVAEGTSSFEEVDRAVS